MLRFLEILLPILMVLCVLTLGVAIADYQWGAASWHWTKPALTVDAEILSFDPVEVGQSRTVTFTFRNNTSYEISLIGAGRG